MPHNPSTPGPPPAPLWREQAHQQAEGPAETDPVKEQIAQAKAGFRRKGKDLLGGTGL